MVSITTTSKGATITRKHKLEYFATSSITRLVYSTRASESDSRVPNMVSKLKLNEQKRQHRCATQLARSHSLAASSAQSHAVQPTHSSTCLHRERAQPAHRKKLGHLEKHQDYVKRARDFHSKEDRIQKLREKASFRNKDEFYFGMIKSKTKVRPTAPKDRRPTRKKVDACSLSLQKGIHVQSRGNEPLPTDLVKALKTQDATYIRMQATMEQGVSLWRREFPSRSGN